MAAQELFRYFGNKRNPIVTGKEPDRQTTPERCHPSLRIVSVRCFQTMGKKNPDERTLAGKSV